MPKQTFYNLSEDKRKLIDEVLKDEFSTKPYKDCNVKNIGRCSSQQDKAQLFGATFRRIWQDEFYCLACS